MGQSNTQREKIKELLWNHFGQWVPLPEILPLAAQYSARIHELRRELRANGYEILNKAKRQGDGTTHSWFKLDYAAAVDATPTRKSTRVERVAWFEKTFGKPSLPGPKEAEPDPGLLFEPAVRR
jgi:hypothetical protein